MGLILDMSPRALEEVIYFASYVVLDAGDTPLEKKQLLSEPEYREKKAEYGDRFVAQMGAEAVSYTHLTLPTKYNSCRSRWSPYH